MKLFSTEIITKRYYSTVPSFEVLFSSLVEVLMMFTIFQLLLIIYRLVEYRPLLSSLS